LSGGETRPGKQDEIGMASELKLRELRPGDLGWIVHRHGVLYAKEYGWNFEFEALVAGIVSEFVKNYDEEVERCWIAEIDEMVVGSVFIVRHERDVAKLRMLYVEPEARGKGVGRALVETALGFAKAAGYGSVLLWTNPQLTAARRIYESAGFVMVATETERAFGVEFVSQTWKKDFTDGN
jgi:GNAT superfamily N-acetyltransferase